MYDEVKSVSIAPYRTSIARRGAHRAPRFPSPIENEQAATEAFLRIYR
jgi:hypothetical protein